MKLEIDTNHALGQSSTMPFLRNEFPRMLEDLFTMT